MAVCSSCRLAIFLAAGGSGHERAGSGTERMRQVELVQGSGRVVAITWRRFGETTNISFILRATTTVSCSRHPEGSGHLSAHARGGELLVKGAQILAAPLQTHKKGVSVAYSALLPSKRVWVRREISRWANYFGCVYFAARPHLLTAFFVLICFWGCVAPKN